MIKRVLFILLGVLLAAQVFRPDMANPSMDPANDMLDITHAPDDIRQLVRNACYDCHSDQTRYPWYTAITPVNYWMKDHIAEGREHLNFSVWSEYAGSEHAGEAWEEVLEGEMPPGYYTVMHAPARLSDADRRKLADWLRANLGSGEGGHGGHTD